MIECNCYAQFLEEDPRAEIWKQIVPDLKIPLKHPLAHHLNQGQERFFYEGDPKRLNDEQKKKLIDLISEKFLIPKNAVKSDLKHGIMPIMAENIIVLICRIHASLSLRIPDYWTEM